MSYEAIKIDTKYENCATDVSLAVTYLQICRHLELAYHHL